MLSYMVHRITVLKIYYHTSVYDTNGATVTPISQVRSSTMLVLMTTENEKYEFRVTSNGITSIPNFIKICSQVLKLNHANKELERRRDIHGQTYTRLFQAHHAKINK
jgi:hypothetical protein